MKRPRFSPLVFLIALGVVLIVSFASAFLAFGYDDLEFTGFGAKRIAYQIFLVLRFPAHHSTLIRSVLPQIYQQLIFNSVFYAFILTMIASNLRYVKRV